MTFDILVVKVACRYLKLHDMTTILQRLRPMGAIAGKPDET
jgi:hypothetical protein